MNIENKGTLSTITKRPANGKEWGSQPFWIAVDDSSASEFRAADAQDALRIVANNLLSAGPSNGCLKYEFLDDTSFKVRVDWMGAVPWKTYHLAWREMLSLDPIEPFALRAAISESGMTQAEFADKMGLSLRAVQYYVAGQRRVSGPTAKLARMLLAGE